MNIISGTARNLLLTDLPGQEVRPTAGRARKALFDSLGDLTGTGILDLCSGSGAIALEAASRGAAWAVMVEKSPEHSECIRENCRRVTAAGCNAELIEVNADICDFARYAYQLPGPVDLIFADPPYAISGELFRKMASNRKFLDTCRGAKILWEIPDFPGAMGEFIPADHLDKVQFRRFGGTIFLSGTIK